MLPDKISKFKSRIRSRISSNTNLDSELESRLYIESDSNPRLYLHSRRRYLINSIPLLNIVALLVGLVGSMSSNSCYAADATAALIIDDVASGDIGEEGLTETIEAVAPGSTAYSRSHKITVKADGISDYDLIITTPTPEIAGSSGGTLVGGNAVDDNTWGYKWSTDATTTGNYQAINGQNLKDEAAIINNSVDITRYLTFAAKFGKDNTNAGRYSAEVNLNLALTPAGITRTLNYNMNSGSGSIPDASCVDDGNGCSISVNSTTIPTRSGYTFLGWSENSAASSTVAVSFKPGAGGNIFMDKDVTLYAVWFNLGFTPKAGSFGGITTMQQMTSSICAAASIGDTKTLIDNRNYPTINDKQIDNTYTIAKFPDGKCWMTQNLRLVGNNSSSQITSNNSDGSPASGWSLPNTAPGSYAPLSEWEDVGNDIANKAWYSSAMNTTYYTWYAATAGTSANVIAEGSNAGSSICPKGWKLPTGGISGNTDFYNLFSKLGLQYQGQGLSIDDKTAWGANDLTIIQSAPFNFSYTGYIVFSGSLYSSDSTGYWWTRTAWSREYHSNKLTYILYYNDSDLYPGTIDYTKYWGAAIRCVAK